MAPKSVTRKKIRRTGAKRPWQEGARLDLKVLKKTKNKKAENLKSARKPVENVEAAALNSVTEPSSLNSPVLEVFARLVSTFAKTYHSYSAKGEEHIPKEGAALIVFYHGLVPLDAWYFGMTYFLKYKKLIRGLGDRWLFKTPGMRELAQLVGAVEGDPETAFELLQGGQVVGVAPGGVREAISGKSNNYKLVWKNRTGFAKLALRARVPIIPAFTENIEELYRAPFVEKSFFQKLYEKTRLPLVPIIGIGPLPFPAKLTTWFGEPIYPKKNETPEELTERVALAIEDLIHEHQTENS